MFGGSVQTRCAPTRRSRSGRAAQGDAAITLPALRSSQAPAGKHTAVVWQYAPYALEEGWPKLREEYARHVLGLWQSYAPNMTRDKVLAMKIQDPRYRATERQSERSRRGGRHDARPDGVLPAIRRLVELPHAHRGPVHGRRYCHPAAARARGRNAAIIVEDFKPRSGGVDARARGQVQRQRAAGGAVKFLRDFRALYLHSGVERIECG